MRNVFIFSTAIIFMFPVISKANSSRQRRQSNYQKLKFVPDEIILKLKPEAYGKMSIITGIDKSKVTGLPSLDNLNKKHRVARIKKIFDKAGLRVKGRWSLKAKQKRKGLLKLLKIRLKQGTDILKAVSKYQSDPNVEYAEPNYIYHIDATTSNDPDFDQQWGLHNTGLTGGRYDADIDAPEAWDIETGAPDVVIAVVDTGVDWSHPDLADNIWNNPGEIPDNGIDDDGNGYIDDIIGWDFVDTFGGASGEDFVMPDNNPMDGHGHGTHVAGIAGAVTYNGIGISGVAWNCKIMPVRAGYKTPSGDGVLESVDAAQAIVYAAENGAKVISLSWGDYQKSHMIEDAINFATNEGVLICAAAGNGNSSSLIYPAALDNIAVLAVGATDSHDQKASFSNYGDWVDVSAPGTGIYSTYPNDAYTYMSGTSMATPHVAGVAALLFSYYPGISPLEVKTRIMRSVDILPNLSGENSTSGRINTYSALTEEYATPHIFSLSSDTAHVEDTITILGDSFGANQGSGFVNFYLDIDGEIISWSNSTIVCRVPNGAQTGELTVTTSEETSNGVNITILTRFYDETLIENEFLDSGTAQDWQADDQSWLYKLAFSFTFFGREYNSVYVCSNGYLDFTDSNCSFQNSTEKLKTKTMIAPLWDDLITNGQSQYDEDIFIHSPSTDSVSFRWAGERYETGDPVNVEVILYEDGRIKFNYGLGNTDLYPTVGISGGDGNQYHLASYDGINRLNQVQTVLFTHHKQSFTIPLDLGWNLISLPLLSDNNRVSQIMNSVNSGIESVWGFIDASWHIYIPDDTEESNLETMKTGYGYWIKTTQPGLSIQTQGHLKTTSTPLTPSWNLVGYNTCDPQAVTDALTSISGKYVSVWSYVDGVWKVYAPANPGFSDLTTMESGYGYWIYTTEACTWTLP